MMAGLDRELDLLITLLPWNLNHCPNQLENVGIKHSLGTLCSPCPSCLENNSGRPGGLNQDVLPLPHRLNRIYTGV